MLQSYHRRDCAVFLPLYLVAKTVACTPLVGGSLSKWGIQSAGENSSPVHEFTNMTTDMAFECLLVSRDPGVLSIMNKLLGDLSISTNVCRNPAIALDNISEGNADLVIVDWQEDSADLLKRINQSRRWQKPTVMVVSELESDVPGTYSLLRKPVTTESGTRSLKQAYSKLLQGHRQHTRYTLMSSVTATNQDGRLIPISVTNIGEGGIGLSTKDLLVRGDVLSFALLLPDTEIPIVLGARVLWTRQYGAVGCEFTSLPQADRKRLFDWLERKCQIKKPRVEL